MSIKIMTEVWEYAQAKGSELLLLLAIADHADDKGKAYPSLQRLAHKTRLSKRNVQYLLKRLQELGLVQIQRGAGPRGCNLFILHICSGENFARGVQSSAQRGAKAIAPEPSENQDSSENDMENLARRFLTRGSEAYEATIVANTS